MQMIKDPQARLDYCFDWRPVGKEWLEEDEVIADYTITITPTGLTLDDTQEDEGKVTVWLSGGEVGEVYKVACRIETNKTRIEERTKLFKVVNR